MRLGLFGVGLALAVLCAACANDDPSPGTAPRSATAEGAAAPGSATTVHASSFAVDKIEPSPREFGPEALIPSEVPDIPTEIRFTDPGFGPPLVQSGDLKPGGPGPDGIPAINTPRFHRTDEVGFLEENEPVFVLELGGEARAYPLQILVWHEIVNDTVAGIPVAVTYCPLCNSAFAYDRRHEGRVLEFGVSGALWHSSLVMFDRQTFSLWSHFTGQGLLGVFASDQLEQFPVSLASWSQFKTARPDGIVLSRDTGFTKDYGRNPYPGYDDVGSPPFLFEGEVDGRYAAKTRLVGLDLPAGPQAVTNDRLEADRVVALTDGDRPLVVWWQPGTGSALDADTVADGKDVGTTGAFEAVLDGQTLTFEPVDGAFRDHETASTWNVFGTATAGPLTGRQLTAVPHVDTFWFAWAVFQPDTAIVG